MFFEVVENAMVVNNLIVDGVVVNCEWIPVIPSPVTIFKKDGYRYITVGEKEVRLHRVIHEAGRPNLMNEVYELAKLFA